MNWVDSGSIASAAAAFGALIISLISLGKTNKFNARQNELADTTERLNRLQIQRETAAGEAAKKAEMSANVIEVGKNNYKLKVYNKGRGVARNVRFFDLSDPNESFLIASDISNRFPVPILEQYQSIELIAAIHMASPSHAHIKLQWDDETGKDFEKELTPAR